MEHPAEFHRLLREGDRRAAHPARAPRSFTPARPARTPPAWRVGGHTLLNMVVAGALLGTLASYWTASPATTRSAAQRVQFGYCHTGGGTNCVVDGDTFWIGGEKVRIADIDTPETHPPRCAEEERLGFAAGRRLQELLNAGPVTLVEIDRDSDRYGRLLRVVERDGTSLGKVLVSEGLARPWEGRRRSWCGVA